jgi:betaine-aldehyde dehydrogenase
MSTVSQLKELRNFVGGEFKPAREGATLNIVNPSTGEAYATSPLSGPADVDHAMRAARTAFETGWRDTTPSERMGYLLRMADAIEQNAERLVEISGDHPGEAQEPPAWSALDPPAQRGRAFADRSRRSLLRLQLYVRSAQEADCALHSEQQRPPPRGVVPGSS